MIASLIAFLLANKTHLVALVMAAGGIIAALSTKDYVTAFQLIMTALGFSAVHAQVVKSEAATKAFARSR